MSASLPPERSARIQQIFAEVCALPVAERASFLERTCGDDVTLRREVSSLLKYLEESGSPLDRFSENVVAPLLAQYFGDSMDETTADSDPRVGHTISHFEIVEQLGSGGMGIVYRARDTRLGRQVALKFLPSAAGGDRDAKKRFVHEAQAASALDHVNITTVHDIGETAEGDLFIAMPFHSGETLKEKIVSEPLPVETALDYVIQLADGLSKAHGQGIVHRDIKPGNVMVTDDGVIKLLDFGIAKLASGTMLTRPGTAMGTVAYMSPEQARGEEVDHRSDLWSLGVVLYEMLTGRTPFPGDHPRAMLHDILERDPESPQRLRPELPVGVAEVIGSCLAKDPAKRYQCAADLLADLRQVREGLDPAKRRGRTRWAGQVRRRRIAYLGAGLLTAAVVCLLFLSRITAPAGIERLTVLPFENLSGNDENEYFAAGMQDALITRLSQISGLNVISRTSARQFREHELSIQEIAREFDVDYVVEGSLYRADEQVRIQVQLIAVQPDEKHLWAESFERDVRDVFAMQNELTLLIADKIAVALTPDEQQALQAQPIVDPEQYRLYLKGRYYLAKHTPEGYEQGFDYLDQAIAKDPTEPLPYAALALGYGDLAHLPAPPKDAFPRAKALAEKALGLNDRLPEAHAALAEYHLYYSWDLEAARVAFERALALNPNLTTAVANYGWYLFLIPGKDDQAERYIRNAAELDPLDPIYRTWLGWYYGLRQRYDEAIRECERVLEFNPGFPIALFVLGGVYTELGEFERAIQLRIEASNTMPSLLPSLGRTYALAGQTEKAEEVLNRIEKVPVSAWGLAQLYAALGRKDEALEWLETAIKDRHIFSLSIPQVRAFDSLRDEPGYDALLAQVIPLAENEE